MNVTPDTNQLVLAGFMLGQCFVRDVTFPQAEREFEREQAGDGEPPAGPHDWDGDDAMLRYARAIASGEFTPVEDCEGQIRRELQRDFAAAAKCIVAAVNDAPAD